MILNTIIILSASLLFYIVVKQSAIYGYYKYIKHLKEYIDHLEKKSEMAIDASKQILALNDRLVKLVEHYEERMENLDKKIQRMKSQFRGNKEFEKIIKIIKSNQKRGNHDKNKNSRNNSSNGI